MLECAKMDDRKEFQNARIERIRAFAGSKLQETADQFMIYSMQDLYHYDFDWLGRPIFQWPPDIIAMQELIWKIKPDLIIETGIARGGSVVFYASMMALLDHCENMSRKSENPPTTRKVMGIDVDIRAHNKLEIDQHPLRNYMELIEGSSIDTDVISKAAEAARNAKVVLVILDSCHTHEHVYAELENYAPLVSVGSYCVVFDTFIQKAADFVDFAPERNGMKDANPMTAMVDWFRKAEAGEYSNEQGDPLSFEIDKSYTDKLLITSCPEGYLLRTA